MRHHKVQRDFESEPKPDKAFWRADRHRINHLKIPGRARPQYEKGDVTRTLTATNEFWSAHATWRRRDGVWSCIQADPKLQWMRTISFDSIKNELLRRGCSWEWSRELDPDLATIGATSPSKAKEPLPSH